MKWEIWKDNVSSRSPPFLSLHCINSPTAIENALHNKLCRTCNRRRRLNIGFYGCSVPIAVPVGVGRGAAVLVGAAKLVTVMTGACVLAIVGVAATEDATSAVGVVAIAVKLSIGVALSVEGNAVVATVGILAVGVTVADST